MKWFIILLLVCGSLQAKSTDGSDDFKLEFEIKYSFSGSSHSSSYKNVFETTGLLNGLQDRFGSRGSFWSMSSISISDMDHTLKLIKSLDDLRSGPDEGVVTNSRFDFNASYEHLFRPRDKLFMSYSTNAYTHLSAYVDMSSLMGYRLFENITGTWWLQDINILVSIFGQKAPPQSNQSAWDWIAKLEELGYTSTQAELLAWLGARNGVDFDGFSGTLLLDFLKNSLDGTGTSLESGSSLLDSNTSGMRRVSLLIQEAAFGYSCPITNWLTVGGAVKYMQGYLFRSFSSIHDLTTNGFGIVSSALLGDTTSSLDPTSAQVRNFGLDVAVSLSPTDGMTFTLSGRNLNAPRFKWKNFVAYVDPQATVQFDYIPKDLPFHLLMSIDLNRTRDLILPNYHNQKLQFKFGVVPEWENGGFSLNVSVTRNIAESNEPFLYGLDVGIRIYAFKMNFGGESSIQSATFPGVSIPERFNFYIALGLSFKW